MENYQISNCLEKNVVYWNENGTWKSLRRLLFDIVFWLQNIGYVKPDVAYCRKTNVLPLSSAFHRRAGQKVWLQQEGQASKNCFLTKAQNALRPMHLTLPGSRVWGAPSPPQRLKKSQTVFEFKKFDWLALRKALFNSCSWSTQGVPDTRAGTRWSSPKLLRLLAWMHSCERQQDEGNPRGETCREALANYIVPKTKREGQVMPFKSIYLLTKWCDDIKLIMEMLVIVRQENQSTGKERILKQSFCLHCIHVLVHILYSSQWADALCNNERISEEEVANSSKKSARCLRCTEHLAQVSMRWMIFTRILTPVTHIEPKNCAADF